MTTPLMMAREFELFELAVSQAVALDRANPEVGMGPSRLTVACRVADSLSFQVRAEDIESAAQQPPHRNR